MIVFLLKCGRLDPGKSLFDRDDFWSERIKDTKASYSPVCSCDMTECGTDGGALSIHIPSFFKSKTTALNMCDRSQQRSVHYSDDLTDEDYDLFKTPLPSETQGRFKRALPVPVISKKTATLYCTENIKNSAVGKRCADIGVDVQEYVESCSLDVSVSSYKL